MRLAVLGFEAPDERMYPHTHAVLEMLRERFEVRYSGADDRGIGRLALGDLLGPGWAGLSHPGRWRPILGTIRAQARMMQNARSFLAEPAAAVIAIDHSAFALAARYVPRRTPIIIWSQDVITADHPWNRSPFIRNLVMRNRENAGRCGLVVVQDGNRASLLDDVMGTAAVPRCLLPVSLPEDDFSRSRAQNGKGGPRQPLVLSMIGSVSEVRGVLPVLEAFSRLGGGYELVLAGFISNAVRRVAESMRNRPACLDRAATLGEMRRRISKVDIGIVVNGSKVSNDRFYSRACGQMVEFLRQGIPIISVFSEELGDFVGQRGIGVHLEDPSGLESALKEIQRDYGAFAGRAYRCFKDLFELDLYRGVMTEAIEKTAAGGRG